MKTITSGPLRKNKFKLLLSFLIGAAIPYSASALKFFGDKCEFTSAELSNPDAVIELTLSGQRSCTTVFNEKRIHPQTELPHFGKWTLNYPEKSIYQLLEKYGVPKNEPFEPSGGDFREWKVRHKRQAEKIDGREIIEYTVELLYVSLTGWTHVPGSGNYGVVPVCERSTVKFYAIKTERGWLIEQPLGIGLSTRSGEQHILKNYYKNNSKEGGKFIARTYRTVQDKCKDHLN